jgi:hypothetical protein
LTFVPPLGAALIPLERLWPKDRSSAEGDVVHIAADRPGARVRISPGKTSGWQTRAGGNHGRKPYIVHMPRYSSAAFAILAGLSILLAWSPAAFAIENFGPASSSTLGQQARDAELRMLRSQIQRQQFQQQQLQDRQQDRQPSLVPSQSPQVPIMTPTCPASIYPNGRATACR